MSPEEIGTGTGVGTHAGTGTHGHGTLPNPQPRRGGSMTPMDAGGNPGSGPLPRPHPGETIVPLNKLRRGGRTTRGRNATMRSRGRMRRLQTGGYVNVQTGKPYSGKVVKRGAQFYTATSSGTYGSNSVLLKKR